MSEKEYQFIQTLKKWVIGLVTALILSICGTVLMSYRSTAITETEMQNIKDKQDQLDSDMKEKASLKMVLSQKETLEQKIEDRFNTVDEKLNVMLQFIAPEYKYKKVK